MVAVKKTAFPGIRPQQIAIDDPMPEYQLCVQKGNRCCYDPIPEKMGKSFPHGIVIVNVRGVDSTRCDLRTGKFIVPLIGVKYDFSLSHDVTAFPKLYNMVFDTILSYHKSHVNSF